MMKLKKMRWKKDYLLTAAVFFSIILAAFIFNMLRSSIEDSKEQKRIVIAMLADYDSGRGRTANGTVTGVNRGVNVSWSNNSGSSHASSRTTFVLSYEFTAGDVLYRAAFSIIKQGNVPFLQEYPPRGGLIEILYDPANPARNMPLIWARDIAQTNYNLFLVIGAVILVSFVTLTLIIYRSKR
jgi:hypothetical protein